MLERRVERIRNHRRLEVPDGAMLPSMVTDIETLIDVLDAAGTYWQEQFALDGELPPAIEYAFNINTSKNVTKDELFQLSVHERNALVATVTVGAKSMQIVCGAASLYLTPENQHDSRFVETVAVRTLLQGGSWRPTWTRVTPWLPLLPAALIVVGAILLVVQGGVTPAWALLGLGAGSLLIASAVVWTRRLRESRRLSPGSIRFRAQSRQELYASRADRWANLKVALITAPVSIIAALFIAWATGSFGE